MMSDRTIAIYVRVSSKKQDFRSQLPDLKQWVAAYAEGATVQWYDDKASGRNMDRPGWQQLEADIDTGKISTLVVWRLDRLGRTASGLTTLFEKLNTRKVNLVSIRDGIDLATPAGRLIANVLASVAAFENELRSERIVAGQQAARENGQKWGGSQKGRQLTVTDDSIRLVHQMAAQGEKKAAIVRATKLSRSTVYRILSDGQPS